MQNHDNDNHRQAKIRFVPSNAKALMVSMWKVFWHNKWTPETKMPRVCKNQELLAATLLATNDQYIFELTL